MISALLAGGGCSSDAVPLDASTVVAAVPDRGKPVAESLLGLGLGEGGVLLACAGRNAPSAPCLSALSDQDPLTSGDGLYALQLAGPIALEGVQSRGSALRLGDTVESLGVVISGERAVQSLVQRLDAMCGAAQFQSRLPFDDGSAMQAHAWQCQGAWVTLNALDQGTQWRASLVLSTQRGRHWLETTQAVVNEDAMAVLASPQTEGGIPVR